MRLMAKTHTTNARASPRCPERRSPMFPSRRPPDTPPGAGTRCTYRGIDAKNAGQVSFGDSKGGVLRRERAPSSDGQNMGTEDRRQVREGVRQGDAPPAESEGQPQPRQPPPLR